MDVSESDKKLWELIRRHGLEAGRAEWEEWRREREAQIEEQLAERFEHASIMSSRPRRS